MLQNALRLFLFGHFNIITLTNYFSERFELRYERDQPFSVPVLIERKILILITVLEPLWLSLLNDFCSVLEQYL
jgi:hypothetical protein